MAKKSKQLRAALEKIDSTKAYSVEEAVALAKETNFAKFDATVEVAYNLNIDVKKADQQIRGAMVLPNGTGKTSRVLVFARGAKAEEAKAAGADFVGEDFVGEDDLVAKINDGWLDFDVVIATPDMMALVGRLGRVLGPRNLMPNPKTGTVTMDVAKAVEESKGGKITYRADRAGNVQAIIGKVSFEAEKLVENFKAFNETIQKAKPATAKGTYVTNLTITTTQGVGIKVDVNSL
ncbi:50S ribosomal protein L1 [Streptococcus pneumoniae]